VDAGTADVVVVGAGHNGLITAAYLAAAGVDVVVLEEREAVGGNTVTEALTLPGFAHDSCSSAHVLIQSNPLIRDDELGLVAAGLRYVHADPAAVFPDLDGEPFVMWRGAERTAAGIAAWSAQDAGAYQALLAEWAGGLRAAHSRWNAGRLAPRGSVVDARYAGLRRRSAAEVIRERFQHPRTRDLLTWLSFLTIQPPDRPGTGILPFAITAGRDQFGWATPIGGSGALPQALVGFLTAGGARVRTGAGVEEILVSGGRAGAVRTAGGEVVRARRAVVCSAHLTQLPGMLRGVTVPVEMLAAAAAWRPGLTLFAVHLALRGEFRHPPGTEGVASVAGGLGSARGLEEQLAAFGRGELYDADPWLLLVCPSVVDPGRAPAGASVLKLLTVAPYPPPDVGGMSWDRERAWFAERLVSRVAQAVGAPAADDVLATLAEGPPELERRNRHNVGGSCHGGEFLAPGGGVLVGWPRHRLRIPGLYLTGSTSHPGGSVAGRAGRNCARVVLQDLGIAPETVMGPD